MILPNTSVIASFLYAHVASLLFSTYAEIVPEMMGEEESVSAVEAEIQKVSHQETRAMGCQLGQELEEGKDRETG